MPWHTVKTHLSNRVGKKSREINILQCLKPRGVEDNHAVRLIDVVSVPLPDDQPNIPLEHAREHLNHWLPSKPEGTIDAKVLTETIGQPVDGTAQSLAVLSVRISDSSMCPQS